MTSADRLSDIVAREADGATDFAALTEACEGAWPEHIRDVLAQRDDEDAKRLMASVAAPSRRIASDRRLPLPHPLDADWRFTRETAGRVLDLILNTTPATSDVLLIAMPTVALAAHDRGLSHRIVVASRDHDPVDDALKVAMPSCRFARLRELPPAAFATVAIDPPWYDDVATPLIETGFGAIDTGGQMFICAPDRLTRTSAAHRLSALTTNPEALGFSNAETITRLRYATPFFEMRCLEALGLTNVSPSWRTGFLLTCTPAERRLTRPRSCAPIVAEWQELLHGPIRIWIRSRPAPDTGATVTVTVGRSISRTDPTRDIAGLWTSGNTVATRIGAVARGAIQQTLENPKIDKDTWRKALNIAVEDELAAIKRGVEFF